MGVSTGKLDICKQKMVLLITGVGAKDQPGWRILKGVQESYDLQSAFYDPGYG